MIAFPALKWVDRLVYNWKQNGETARISGGALFEGR
mgnify:CR=1 FL=1